MTALLPAVFEWWKSSRLSIRMPELNCFYSAGSRYQVFSCGSAVSIMSEKSAGVAAPATVVRAPEPPPPSTAAFEAVALPLSNVLYATAYRLTGNHSRAEDLVQETFVRAWQKFNHFQTGTNFKAWIFKILIFLHKNESRGLRNAPVPLEVGAEAAGTLAPEPKPIRSSGVEWAKLYEHDVDDEFKRALDRLDEDHRAVLMLVTLGEFSYQECADTLNLPLGTVMSRLYRARKQLQADLHEYACEKGVLRRGKDGEQP
jgi:RNA polymerase sigma-70 factor, ECF subfamily